MYKKSLLVLDRGEGCIVWDVEGNPYFDAFAGLSVVNVGYGRQEIADAIAAQARQLSYVNGLAYTAPVTIKLGHKLASMLPSDLSRVFFCSGGSEATESAMKIAKQYHVLRGDTRRFKVIGRWGSYHGATYGSMSVSGNFRRLTHRYFEPLMPGALHVPGHYCYRCYFGMSYPTCELRCAQAIEQEIQLHGEESIAAVIGEPVPAGPGALVPPQEYWPLVREICDRYGVLLIADEVINGFGRTGRMFACEHWGLAPDIITLANEVMVQVEACGICGSDLRYYLGENPWALHTKGAAFANPPNIVLGHEFVGRVVDTGGSQGESLLGKRVVVLPYRVCQTCYNCRRGMHNICPNMIHYGHGAGWGKMDYYPGGMAEFCPVWAEKCYVLPEHVPPHEAALVDGLGVAVHAVRTAGFRHGKDIAVIGCGPIGMGIAAVARACGAREIFCVDVYDVALSIAREVTGGHAIPEPEVPV